MFFKMTKTRTVPVLQLVRSFRDSEGRPRQKVVLSLGNPNLPKNLWKPVAQELQNRLKGIESLFKCSSEIEEWVEWILPQLERKQNQPKKIKDVISIDPSKITHRHSTDLGPILLAHRAWEALEITSLLTRLGFLTAEIRDVAISVINRLIDPCSENALPEWVKTTSMEDLWGYPFRKLSKDRFYRVADKLLENKIQIESALSEKEEALFSLDRTFYLYDLTNTYLEGSGKRNIKAKRGNSKEKRKDCPLISLGLVLDRQGFVIQHQTFSGNTHDSRTLLSMLEELKSKDPKPPAIIIVDSGLASEENLKMLKSKGYDYIVVGKRPTRAAFEHEFATLPFSTIAGREEKNPVEVAIKEEATETLVLCKSALRGKKEKAIFSHAEERLIKDLESLKKSIDNKRFKTKEVIERKIGKLLGKHSRAGRYYKVDLIKQINGEASLKWERKDKLCERDAPLFGTYYLRCSRKGLKADEIWRLYVMLTRVEAGFKTLKSTLGLRPIYHQREDRSDSHLFITILAYHLLNWIEYSLRNQRDYRSWETIRRILQTHRYTTIVCPTINGKTLTIRTPGQPDSHQRAIYQALKIDYQNLPRNEIVA